MAAFHAVEGLLKAIPMVCEDRTNISLDGFVCLLYTRLTKTVLDAELLDMNRINDAVESGRRLHLISENGSDIIN